MGKQTDFALNADEAVILHNYVSITIDLYEMVTGIRVHGPDKTPMWRAHSIEPQSITLYPYIDGHSKIYEIPVDSAAFGHRAYHKEVWNALNYIYERS